MNKSQYICIIVFVVVMLVALPIFYLVDNKNGLTKSEAIYLLKTAYPEFKNYPNGNLPPQSIQTKKASNGWYIVFVQEG